MPLLFSKKINPYSAYAVWKITETEHQLVDLCHLTPPEMLPDKRSEWMVSRILIQYLLDSFELPFNGMETLPTGKPILRDSSAQISITHSFPFAATLINLRKNCGIDLESEREKLVKVQRKFLHSSEQAYQGQLPALTKIWCAKEVVFKVHGDKNLSFQHEISVSFESEESAVGRILKPDSSAEIALRFERVLDYWLCYSI